MEIYIVNRVKSMERRIDDKLDVEEEMTVDKEGLLCFLTRDGDLRYPQVECMYCRHQQNLFITFGSRVRDTLRQRACVRCGRRSKLELLDRVIQDLTWLTTDRIVESDIRELYIDVRAFVKEHVDFREPVLYDIVSAWIFHTWFKEFFNATTHMIFMGLTKTGKTRALETMRVLAYHGTLVASLTPASLFRSIDEKNVTPFISEYQDLHHDEKREIDAIVKAGQKRGEVILRSKPIRGGEYETVTFDPFTAIAIGTQVTPREDLANRAFQISMSDMVRRLKKFIDYEQAKELLPQLVYQRYYLSEHKLEEARVLADAWLDRKRIRGREYERYLPLLTMFYLCGVDPEEFSDAINYDLSHQREIARASYDAIFISELLKLYEEEKEKTVTITEESEVFARIKVSELRNRLGMTLGEDIKALSSQKVGLDCKRLQLLTKRYRDGMYIVDPHLAEKLSFYNERFALGLMEERMKPPIESLIYETVVEFSMQDERGALVDAVAVRVGEEYTAVEAQRKIDELIEEGDLLINHKDDAGMYVVRG